jgi:SAM-dependent methyltransferase
MKRVLALAAAALIAAGAWAGDAPPRYTQQAPGKDGGTGKVYMGREIAFVMGHQGAVWLERPGREKEERPDLLYAALDLKPGMTVADIGAGSGYHARRLARAVGPGGTVYGVDIQPEMLALLERNARAEKLANLRPVLGTATDPKLAPASLDLALMVDVYHEFEFPYEMLAAIVAALKPGGLVVFVEFKAEDPKVGILPAHKMSEAQVKREAAVHGLQWVKTVHSLPWQHVIVFRRP